MGPAWSWAGCARPKSVSRDAPASEALGSTIQPRDATNSSLWGWLPQPGALWWPVRPVRTIVFGHAKGSRTEPLRSCGEASTSSSEARSSGWSPSVETAAGDRRACPRTRKVRGNAATPPRGDAAPAETESQHAYTQGRSGGSGAPNRTTNRRSGSWARRKTRRPRGPRRRTRRPRRPNPRRTPRAQLRRPSLRPQVRDARRASRGRFARVGDARWEPSRPQEPWAGLHEIIGRSAGRGQWVNSNGPPDLPSTTRCLLVRSFLVCHRSWPWMSRGSSRATN